MEHTHQVIICIVNAGYSDAVMSAARNAGASGGSIVRARGTANPKAEKLFNITIQPEKELILIVVAAEICDAVLHAIYKEAGLDTQSQGIAFSLPIDEVVGFKEYKPLTEETKKKPEHT